MAANTQGSGPVEWVDVIDDAGDVVAVVTRAQMRRERLRHRCTFVVVRSTRGEVLIHRRAEHKDLWPSRWDLACGGVVTSGEEWLDSAQRELSEELGIDGVELVELTTGSFTDDDVDEVVRAWQVVHDGPFRFDDGEVVEAHFVTPTELAARLRRDRFVPDSVAILADLLVAEPAS